MGRLGSAAALIFSMLTGCTTSGADSGRSARTSPAVIASAVANPGRPAADRERDAARKPAELIAFAGVKPGDVVVDLLPGGGYFTRLLSKVVGPEGRVYAAVPAAGSRDAQPTAAKIAADPAYANVRVVTLGAGGLTIPEPADVLWTAQNYHDLHLKRLNLDVVAVNRAFYGALKPGGVFLVIDHTATPGAGAGQADTLHRIEPSTARREIEAAGFVLEGESAVLRNPADARTANVFDPAVRGRTDQFVFKFRKPAATG